MQLQIEPDLAIPFPEDNPVLANFREKALAACNSAELLGLDLDASEEEPILREQPDQNAPRLFCGREPGVDVFPAPLRVTDVLLHGGSYARSRVVLARRGKISFA